jgi:hypothetical protein
MLALALPACGGGGGGGGNPAIDGGAGNDDGGGQVSPLSGTWLGPVRLSPCSDLVPLPGVTIQSIVTTIELVIDDTGAVTAFNLDGQSFAIDPNDPYYPTLSITATPTLVDMAFNNVGSASTGLGSPAMLPAINGGGLVLALDGTGNPAYAFVFVHDMWGCDIIQGVAQKGATAVPTYALADLDGSWMGSSAQYTDNTGPDGVPLSLHFDGIMQPWTLTAAAGSMSGTLTSKSSQLTVSGGFTTVTNGYYESTMTVNGASWVLKGLLSPDGDFFAGFSYPEEWDFYWHDVVITK